MHSIDSAVIARCLPEWNKGEGFYVELGANDGVTGSNSLVLEAFYGWRGVLVEPVGQVFASLGKNRSRRRNKLYNAACVSFSYKEPDLEIAVSNLMSTPLGLDSDLEDPIGHATYGLVVQNLPAGLVLERVEARTLNDILVEAGTPRRVNFLSVDVEGAELEVLKGIDFDLFSFDFILVECRSFPRMRQFLNGKGYVLDSQIAPLDYLFRLDQP